MEEFFRNIWDALVKCYMVYSDFVHSIIPSALGDLVVYIIDILVVVAIIKVIANFAFGTRGN